MKQESNYVHVFYVWYPYLVIGSKLHNFLSYFYICKYLVIIVKFLPISFKYLYDKIWYINLASFKSWSAAYKVLIPCLDLALLYVLWFCSALPTIVLGVYGFSNIRIRTSLNETFIAVMRIWWRQIGTLQYSLMIPWTRTRYIA